MVAISFDTLKADATGQELATKSDIVLAKTDLRLEISNSKNEILRWIVPLILAQMGLLIGILLKLPSP